MTGYITTDSVIDMAMKQFDISETERDKVKFFMDSYLTAKKVEEEQLRTELYKALKSKWDEANKESLARYFGDTEGESDHEKT